MIQCITTIYFPVETPMQSCLVEQRFCTVLLEPTKGINSIQYINDKGTVNLYNSTYVTSISSLCIDRKCFRSIGDPVAIIGVTDIVLNEK